MAQYHFTSTHIAAATKDAETHTLGPITSESIGSRTVPPAMDAIRVHELEK